MLWNGRWYRYGEIMNPVKLETSENKPPADTTSSAAATPQTAQPERRKQPRPWETPPAPVPPPHFNDYEPIVGRANLDELRFLASRVKGKSVKMVNSTAVGG